MAHQALATPSTRESTPVIHVGHPDDDIKKIFDSLARRAFAIFESNGRPFGHELADWLQAERERFHAAHMDVSESNEGFSVRAEVPGFAAKDLEINLEGRRLTISGKREKHEERKDKKSVYSEGCSDQIFRVVDLPTDVNSESATANLKDGILELEIPKATPAKKVPIASKAA
jgi:HSP20 family protein